MRNHTLHRVCNILNIRVLRGRVTSNESWGLMVVAVSGLSTEISGLSTEISGLSTEISGLSTEISSLSTKISGRLTEITQCLIALIIEMSQHLRWGCLLYHPAKQPFTVIC